MNAFDRKRASYAEAGEAMRVAFERAKASGAVLSRGDWIVFCACLVQIGSYSRVEDRISRKKLAEITGLSEWTVSRALKRLDAVGVIEWCPSHTWGQSRVKLTPIVF